MVQNIYNTNEVGGFLKRKQLSIKGLSCLIKWKLYIWLLEVIKWLYELNVANIVIELDCKIVVEGIRRWLIIINNYNNIMILGLLYLFGRRS